LSAGQRPNDVALLVLLEILLAILFVSGVFVLTVLGFSLPEVVPHVRFFPVRLLTITIVLLVLAGVEFVLAYGIWNGKGWAWIVSLAFAVLGIIFFTFSLFLRPSFGEIAALIIDLLLLYYLMQPRVQSYFGKGAKAPL
jgi:uncharacterized membrane protein (DUF2068 family)